MEVGKGKMMRGEKRTRGGRGEMRRRVEMDRRDRAGERSSGRGEK